MKKTILSLAFASCFAQPLQAAVVFINFEGDPAFPSITLSNPSGGLADFTGSAFGSTANEAALEAAILAHIQADFAPYNVTFSTALPAGTVGTDFFYYGIDDSAFTFESVVGSGEFDNRLFGRVNTPPNVAPASIYARTWAGSFALNGINGPFGGTNQAVSSPVLNFLNHTVDQISQALANNAAHEIAHIFGVAHEGLDAGQASVPQCLMETNIESVMISTNKVFCGPSATQLLSFLGPAQDGDVPEPATLALLGLGLAGIGLSRRKRT